MILKPTIRTPSFFFDQAEPAATWTIQHNLAKFPSVVVVDSSNRVMMGGDIQYVDTNTLTITFSSPFSGTAVLN